MENKQIVRLSVSEKEKIANSICPHCKKEIDPLATKCPYCQSDLRIWGKRHPIAIIFIIILCLLFVKIFWDVMVKARQEIDARDARANSSLTQSSQTPVSLESAIKNYSDNSAYSFTDGTGSNVDVFGIVKKIIPAQTGVTAAFGNTVIIEDGIYSAAVHQINDSDFQNLIIGETVEVKGGYIQSPENNVVQIVNISSVQKYSKD